MSDKPRWYYERFEAEAKRLSFADRLEQAHELANAIALQPALDERHAKSIARLCALLDDLDCKVPEFKTWCVVKHYHGHVPGGSWEPRVWTAHAFKKQAEAFAPAIEKYYLDRDIERGWSRADAEGRKDRFKVEYREATVSDLIDPRLTAVDYVKGLL